MSGPSRRIRALIPPIAWRDDLLARRESQVRELTARVRDLESELAAYRGEKSDHRLEPSFRRHVLSTRGTAKTIWRTPGASQHPLIQVPYKLRTYRLAASHGITVPEVLAVWSEPAQIDLTDLPERFVVKSDRGAGSHGVLPLRRTGSDRYAVLGSAESRELDEAGVRAHFAGSTSTGGPYFAEGLIEQLGAAPGALPDDVKVYAFQGEVGHVLLRRAAVHGNPDTVSSRYLRPDGSDLGADIIPGRLDPAIPVPEAFAEMVEIARHLSRAVALPFVRVDLYDTPTGPVLGELTRTPGGRQLYRPDHDRLLGELWDLARLRLDVAIQAGRPPFTLHGPVEPPHLYPPGHASRRADATHWTVHTAACEDWCRG